MMKRSADEADVGAVIAEFKATDDMLDRMGKDLKSWRDDWEDLLRYQSDISGTFTTLYKPVGAASNPNGREGPADTPAHYMNKCLGLDKTFVDLKEDLAQEIGMIATKLIRPIEDAKASTKQLHKTLKHRENMKLDYERYHGRAENARKKDNKSAKDDAALAKHENELAQAYIDYQTADDQVKQTFPPVTEAVLSLLPALLASQVMLQTTLVGQLYTVLDAYCREHHLPSPAPSEADVISSFEQDFTPLRKELESGFRMIANGKAIKQPMDLTSKGGSSLTGMGIRNKVMNLKTPMAVSQGTGANLAITNAPHDYAQDEEEAPPTKPPRPTNLPSPSFNNQASIPYRSAASPRSFSTGSQFLPQEEEAPPQKPPRPSASPAYGGQSPALSAYGGQLSVPSAFKPRSASAPYDQNPTASLPFPEQQNPSWTKSVSPRSLSPTSARFGNNLSNKLSPVSGAGTEYFDSNARRLSNHSLASSAASVVAGRKKPPPPVPTKRIASAQAQYVTALYDFEGQNAGDLFFREGDRIRVVKKTDSTDDWWDGEIQGRTGAFPANYVQV